MVPRFHTCRVSTVAPVASMMLHSPCTPGLMSASGSAIHATEPEFSRGLAEVSTPITSIGSMWILRGACSVMSTRNTGLNIALATIAALN